MNQKSLPSVDILNQIQAIWMALEPDAPEDRKKAVYDALKLCPAIHLSVNRSKTEANVMVDSMPMWANRRPIAEAVKFVQDMQSPFKQKRTDVAWCGQTGEWVAL